jgi:hypothetical protein
MAAMARRQRQQQMQEMAVAPGPGLQEVLKPEVLTPLLQDPEVSCHDMSFLKNDMLSPSVVWRAAAADAGDGSCAWA